MIKMTPFPASANDQDFLYDLLDRALALIEDGQPVEIDALLSGFEHLRERAAEMVRLASRAGVSTSRSLPALPGYSVISELGRGGMGAVYLARQQRLGGRPVALKVLPSASGLSQRARRRFTAEALAIGKLSHPNIVAIYDVVDDGDTLAYAMEWIDGRSLAQMIHDYASEGNHAEIGHVCRLGIAIAGALSVVHRAGLVHRDVKPSNILMRADGTPLLSDFGLVREADSTLTEAGQFAGTVAYAAPEQLRGDHTGVDARSDVYSLGVMLYHALVLRLPFNAVDPGMMLREIERGPSVTIRRANPSVPRDLETIIAKAMDADPMRRYQTADDLADDLKRLLSFQPIHARRVGIARRMAKLVRRNRAAAIGLAIGSVLSLVLAASIVVYVFVAPHWAAAHVTDARLALLDPSHGNQIFLVSFFGNTKPGLPATSPVAMQSSLSSYDLALRWAPFDGAIRREREIVHWANDEMRKGIPGSPALPVPASPASSTSSDPRSRGLYALLMGDPANALDAWSGIDIEHDPDPLMAAAMGILYLSGDEPGRAYLPLRDACQALPNVGFLTVYQADAAVRCGDLARAVRLLEAARQMPRPDPLGGLERVEADLAMAQGRLADAERLYRRIVGNPIAQFRLARLLESTGRLQEAVAEYRRLRAVVPNGPKPRAAFVAAAERWWASVKPARRLRMIRGALHEPINRPTALSGLLRDYANAAQPSERFRTAHSHSSTYRSTFFLVNRSPSLQSLSLLE
ncbi:MAG TPA: protein kinase, partial [Phycisphaerae bacterium]|nr:protein kinase [Phycisphaerae bacterium]